jgi:hypothetical protein
MTLSPGKGSKLLEILVKTLRDNDTFLSSLHQADLA